MRRFVFRDSLGMAIAVALVVGCLGAFGCGGKKSADSGTPDGKTAVPREFDVIVQAELVSKGVYLLDGEKLQLAMGFPNSPRITDLKSQEETAITMTLKRQSGDAQAIIGKWSIESAVRGGKVDTDAVGEVVEFTAEKMIRTRPDGRSQESAYRLGGVPPQAAAGQADTLAALRAAGAEIELGSDGQAVSVSIMFQASSDEQLAKIASMSSLRSLELVKVTGLSAGGIGSLSKLSELEKLALMCDDVTAEWLVPVAGLTKLKSLELSNSRQLGDDGLQHLRGLTELTELRLADTKVSDEGLKHLAELTNLEQLELKRTAVTDAGLVHLQGMTKLREVDVSGGGVVNGEILSGITDAGVAHLKKLDNLQTLGLAATKITDAGLLELSGCKNLKMLLITFCDNVTDDGVKRFKAALPACEVRGPGVEKR